MTIPDGRICAINFLTLKSGATLEQFETFSTEIDQPICLAQDVVEGLDAYAVRHRGPGAPAIDVVEILTVRDWREWERVQDSHAAMEPVMAKFDRLVESTGVHAMFASRISRQL